MSITTTIAMSFHGPLLGFGASVGFGVVSIFFPLNSAELLAFGIKVVSNIYIPIIRTHCAVATD